MIEGISAEDWSRERDEFQNPRVRAMLGCINLLDEVMETDYHLLHCAPRRLVRTWEQVRGLASVLRHSLPELLEEPSKIPGIEAVRKDAHIALTLLGHTLLAEIEAFPAEPPPERIDELRKLLCSAMGQLQIFLYENFARLVAADPRSTRSAEYYLSQRFPAEIEESTWLYEMVSELNDYLKTLDEARRSLLEPVSAQLQHEQRLPTGETWEQVSDLIDGIQDELCRRLKEILSLHGIRFEELSAIKRYALEIPTKCHKVLEIYDLSAELLRSFDRHHRDDGDPVRQECRTALCLRLGRLLGELDLTIRDLTAFVPLWQTNIEGRRTMALKSRLRDESRETSSSRPQLVPAPPTG